MVWFHHLLNETVDVSSVSLSKFGDETITAPRTLDAKILHGALSKIGKTGENLGEIHDFDYRIVVREEVFEHEVIQVNAGKWLPILRVVFMSSPYTKLKMWVVYV